MNETSTSEMATDRMSGFGASPRDESVAVKALIVDDDPALLELLSIFLEARGYEVAHMPDGEAALQRLRTEGGFNLVITDRHMPRMDGLSLCRAIRALSSSTTSSYTSSSYIYCVMLTASGDGDSLVSAMEAGVDDFIAKPLNFEELGARLHAAERVLTLESGLASRNRRLAQAYDQLRRELKLARSLQRAQLPAPARFGPANFHWVFEASSYVGGDIFDFFPVDESRVAFHVVDVAGHGVAAAMVAFNAHHQLLATTQHTALDFLRSGASLGEAAVAVVHEMNLRVLGMNDPSLYMTMVYALLDVDTGRMAYVQAGHPAPLVAAPGAGHAEAGDSDLPVGVMEDAEFHAHELQLGPGSRVVLYSDGVTECRNARGEAFGARLVGLLDHFRHAPPAEFGRELDAALGAWRAGSGYEDDVTLLMLEFTG